MKVSSLPTCLPTYHQKIDEDSDEEDIPEWAEYENLKIALEKQKNENLYELFQSDLFHPPIVKMMSMNPSAAKKFEKRNSSADWSHIQNASPQQREKIFQARELNRLKKKYSLKDFDIGRVLGKGRFATVYLARERTHGYIVVLKVIYKAILAKYQAERAIRSEIEIQAHLRHENIVQIYGYFHDNERIYLILEYAMNGDIFNDVQLCRLDENTAASYTLQVSKALQYMHDHFVIHRDIKLENVYLSDQGIIKVGDFGWSVHTHKLQNDKIVGTLHYMAPEMLRPDYEVYDHKVDNWALGILLYEMLVSALPFYGDTEEELEQRILRAPLHIPGFVSRGASDLIRKLLERDPVKRIELKDIANHPWVTKCLGIRSLKEMCVRFIQETHQYYSYDLGKLSPHKLSQEVKSDIVNHRFFSE